MFGGHHGLDVLKLILVVEHTTRSVHSYHRIAMSIHVAWTFVASLKEVRGSDTGTDGEHGTPGRDHLSPHQLRAQKRAF